MVSRYRDWLRQSKRNLTSAIVNYRENLYEESCFESHQAAEKALKALLNYFHKERRGYSLLFLLSEAFPEPLEDIKQCVLYLDKHYTPSRYPDVYDEGAPMDYYSKEDADKCISCAKRIIEWVESIVR
ncbi:MAG: HEPN domain-containing protein [Sulfolobales archaeon]